MLEAVKEMCFIFYLLTNMLIEVKLPIIVRCDNVDAIFMAENLSSGACTRHVDIRYHFVCEHVVDEMCNLKSLLLKYEPLFDGSLSNWKTDPVDEQLKLEEMPFHLSPFPVPKIHEETLKYEIQ